MVDVFFTLRGIVILVFKESSVTLSFGYTDMNSVTSHSHTGSLEWDLKYNINF